MSRAFLFLSFRRPPCTTLFPYTTLFRSRSVGAGLAGVELRPLPGPCGHSPTLNQGVVGVQPDRKSTRLNSSHSQISYAVFCLKKKRTSEVQLLAKLKHYHFFQPHPHHLPAAQVQLLNMLHPVHLFQPNSHTPAHHDTHNSNTH